MILMYHNIVRQGRFNTLGLSDFEDHLKFLSSGNKYRLLSLADYLKFEHKNQIAITFDDAYICLKDSVLPLIEKYKAPIAIFVPVAHVGKNNAWDIAKGHEAIQIMDWESIRLLNENPLITIGSHGCQHVSIGLRGRDCYEEEFGRSKLVLEGKLGETVDFFAYPYGQYRDVPQQESVDFFEKWAYKAYLTTNWSRKNTKMDQFKLNRLEMLENYNVAYLEKILSRTIDPRRYKQILKNFLYRLKVLK